MKKNITFILLSLSLFLFASCSKKAIYEKIVYFPDNNWTFENKAVTFTIPLPGSDNPFSVILELELVGPLNVDMFYASFTFISPGGGKTIKPLTFNFITPHEPYIYKKGAPSNERTLRLTLYPKKYFSEPGDYTFEINQFSNKADNYGIKSISLRIEPVKE
ncbi:MAG: hypothetical protein LBI45_04800 [Bacteroidales bacterium]|jgi:hypothetical protein|nr:hypothetical protein [Bacteroidales bacterium]